jgi:plasmid stabilization system protein ParE
VTKLIFHPEARQDLKDRIEFIAGRVGWTSANRQLARAQASFKSIEQFPRASKYNKRRDVYESWIPKTRLIVLYRVLEQDKVVYVLAIIDHSRNTARVKGKLLSSRS